MKGSENSSDTCLHPWERARAESLAQVKETGEPNTGKGKRPLRLTSKSTVINVVKVNREIGAADIGAPEQRNESDRGCHCSLSPYSS